MDNENQIRPEEAAEIRPAKPRKNKLKIFLFSILEGIIVAAMVLIATGPIDDYCNSMFIEYEGKTSFDHAVTDYDGTEYPAGTEFEIEFLSRYGEMWLIDPATGRSLTTHFRTDETVDKDELKTYIKEYTTNARNMAYLKAAITFAAVVLAASGIFFAINFNLKTCGQVIVLIVTAVICAVLAFFWNSYSARAKAPVVYLYPEEDTEVNVRLLIDGELNATYPFYDEELGWNVTAAPDGTLTDAEGREYPYLFWEGDLKIDPDLSLGFCVKGEDTVPFLEKSLKDLGLNDKEAAAFISFWLPYMKDSNYNVITFQTYAYEDAASMDISPVPDTVIRVNMLWYPSDSFVEMKEPDLKSMNPAERSGFTVVEWGGEKYERGILSTLFR